MVLVGEDRYAERSLVASMIFSSPFYEIASAVGISSWPYFISQFDLYSVDTSFIQYLTAEFGELLE